MVPSVDEIGHGTAMASAAAGSALNGGLDFLGGGSGCGYRGSETEAGETVFAGLLYDAG